MKDWEQTWACILCRHADGLTAILRCCAHRFAQGKVLCPLVNVPMIDYTLEFLARNDVKEVFVFCVSHAKELEDYLNASTWGEQLEVGP